MKKTIIYLNDDNKIAPIDAPNEVRVAFVSDNSFVDFLGVAINSVIQNASDKRFYDILVMTSDISDENMKRVLSLQNNRKNISIRFVFIDKYIEKMNFVVSGNYNKFTFYRLLLPDITESMEKILYLDADIVVNADIASLYDVPFDGNAIVGTYDVQIAAWQNYDNGMRAYFRALGMEKSGEYVQAGVLLLNLEWMRENETMHKAIMRGIQDKFIFNDQDLINIYFKNNIKIVDLKWNVLNLSENGSANCRNYLNESQRIEYEEALLNPYIIHFAERSFPCYRQDGNFVQLYWSYAKNTTFYEELQNKKIEYENTLKNQVQENCLNEPKDNEYKAMIKRYLKKIPFLVAVVKYLKRKGQVTQAYDLEFSDMNVIGAAIRKGSRLELKPESEISGMHYDWGKGRYKIKIPVEYIKEVSDENSVKAVVYAGCRHIILLEQALHEGDNELTCELKENQLDVELMIKNDSKCGVELNHISWEYDGNMS